jgi:hypothetical protein
VCVVVSIVGHPHAAPRGSWRLGRVTAVSQDGYGYPRIEAVGRIRLTGRDVPSHTLTTDQRRLTHAISIPPIVSGMGTLFLRARDLWTDWQVRGEPTFRDRKAMQTYVRTFMTEKPTKGAA